MAEPEKAPPPPKKTTPGKSSVAAKTSGPASTVEETMQALKTRVDRNQQSTQRSIDSIAEDQRKAREENGAQFANIASALAAIQASLQQATSSSIACSNPLPTTTPQNQPFGAIVPQATLATPQLSSSSLAPTVTSEASSVGRQAARKLHDLPPFSGAPEEWPKFIAMYQQSTEAYGYSSLDNSIRLQHCLTGDAKEAVDCMLMDVHGTAAVIDALEFRFGRPELLAQAQLRRIRDIPAIAEQRAELIVPFASKVANMLAYLDQPKTQQYLVNPELLEQLVQKLPMSRRHDWGRHAVDIKPCATIRDFSTWLQDLARCVSYMTPAATLAAATQPSFAAKPKSAQAPTGNRRDRIMHANASERNQCDICGAGGHVSGECRRLVRQTVAERWDTVRSKRLCFGCLRRGHTTAQCETKTQCGIDNCTRSHNQLLHTTMTRRNPFARGQQPAVANAASSEQASQPVADAGPTHDADNAGRERVHNCQPIAANESRIMFRILPVRLFAGERMLLTYALLDEGSSVTMIDHRIAHELNLSGPERTLDLQWFGSRCASEVSQTVALRISGIGPNQRRYYLGNVRTVSQLDLPAQSVAMADLRRRFDCLRGLPVQDYNNAVPKILIGVDNIYLSVATRQISCTPHGPVATRTRLGWVICGPLQTTDSSIGGPAVLMHQRHESPTAPVDDLHQAVKDYFSLESLGVRISDRTLESRDDARARQIMLHTTVRIGDRFETGLLWRQDQVCFPDSRAMATNRLLSVERKMKRDPIYAAQYSGIIDDYITKGYARLLTSEEAACVDGRTWYLPHFAVTNPNKPGKVRVVFDAAASAGGVSLNSELLKGPDLNRSLMAVLHQFRMGTVGVCADIKEMFLQVRIRADDINSQRFLWRGGDTARPISVYVMQAMIFGAACSPCSAQYVKNANADHYNDEHPAAVKLIKDAHYVDDFVASFNTEDEAAIVTKTIVDIHRRGGFELRGFLSNSHAVLRAVGVEQHAAHDADDAEQESAIDMQLAASAEKILGMYWCTREDAFLFRLTFSRVDPAVVDGSRRPTKRELLSATMSVYDPFGLLANFTIYAKLLLQDLWRHGTGWDEPIPEDVHAKWLQWVAKLDCCRQIRVPRCYEPGIQTKSVQLHIFADASQSAFATVAYWRIEIAPSQWRLAFVSGKARCAPPKLISIPRLELQAAVLAVRLNRSIRSLHDVDVERTIFWSDSKTVVQWVRSDRLQFRPFVAHRIAEILEESTVTDWRWVPTLHNAADDATRAKYPVRFEAQNRWIAGPEFLMHAETEWPVEPAHMPCELGTEEVKPHSVHLVCSNDVPRAVAQFTRFNDFHRACRAMAISLRFIRDIRTKTRTTGQLQPDEIEDAERHLIRAAQADAFPTELATLKRGDQIDRRSSIRSLMPHLDEHGLMRVTGRIDKASHLPVDARNPIIMPKDHHLTFILVTTYHRRMRHRQQAAVVCEIRLKYWVPHLRVVVRRVKNKCMLCRMKSARVIEPVMGQLPIDRLTPYVRAFTYTGVDYFGPLYVTIGRSKVKRWVALFTCMTIRAVHLELASDLSTDACILCIRNFINLRGVPKRIRSDNGTNFVGACRELREAIDLLDHASFEREFSAQKIEWVFNCPSNPEAGGCWERLVQSVKSVLSVTMKEVAPQVETLRSLLLEAANIVNSRPLTMLPVSSDEDEPLTPNHFLLGSASSTQTPGSDEQRLFCMRKQWRVAQALKNRFWKRWILEYLPDLTRRAKGYSEHPTLTVGSLVLICEPDLPRGKWRRGRITEVYPGSDGRIRTASVKTSDGELKRPVTKLAVLDVNV